MIVICRNRNQYRHVMDDYQYGNHNSTYNQWLLAVVLSEYNATDIYYVDPKPAINLFMTNLAGAKYQLWNQLVD